MITILLNVTLAFALITLNVLIIVGGWAILIYSLIHQWDDDYLPPYYKHFPILWPDLFRKRRKPFSTQLTDCAKEWPTEP